MSNTLSNTIRDWRDSRYRQFLAKAVKNDRIKAIDITHLNN